MIKAVLFDYDDTLVKTRASKYAAIKCLGARHYGLNVPDEDIDKVWGIPYHELFRTLFGAVDCYKRAISLYEELTSEFPMQIFEDSLPTLQHLGADRAIGIVTSTSRNVLMPDLEQLGFPIEQMCILQTAEDTAVHKPDPAVFDPAIEQLARWGISAHQILYVGDSFKDYLAASRAGMHFAAIPRGISDRAEFDTVGACVLNSLLELIELDSVARFSSQRV